MKNLYAVRVSKMRPNQRNTPKSLGFLMGVELSYSFCKFDSSIRDAGYFYYYIRSQDIDMTNVIRAGERLFKQHRQRPKQKRRQKPSL